VDWWQWQHRSTLRRWQQDGCFGRCFCSFFWRDGMTIWTGVANGRAARLRRKWHEIHWHGWTPLGSFDAAIISGGGIGTFPSTMNGGWSGGSCRRCSQSSCSRCWCHRRCRRQAWESVSVKNEIDSSRLCSRHCRSHSPAPRS